MNPTAARKKLQSDVARVLSKTPLVDLHTHLYDPALGNVLLWGIDELLTYHYLVAEVFRARPDLSYDAFWKMGKQEQADLIWQELFVLRSPLSEACRGVLTVLHTLGLETKVKNLKAIRKYYAKQNVRGYVDTVLEKANIKRVYMTNDPMDPAEASGWLKGFDRDPRFLGVLRLDSAIMGWPDGAARLRALGYAVDDGLTGNTLSLMRQYLNDGSDRFDARYMAVSLPPTFRYPDVHSPVSEFIAKAVVPVARERGIPVALMIGVKKLVNPALRLAGDSVGKSDIDTVERLARDFGDVRFLITMLARENMHELCIASRKFKNVTPFGCWWFLNNPSLIEEITRMRIETLGQSFVPQHSDCRVLDQMIYKWTHSRAIIAAVLADKYADLAATGWSPTKTEIERDINLMFDVKL